MKYLLCIVSLAIVAGGCVRVRVSAPTPAPAVAEWPLAIQSAAIAADSANYMAAERHLVDFGSRHAGSREASEVLFWRALYRLDPANRAGSLPDGIAVLDRYLADSSTTWYRNEATVLRRIATAAQNSRNTQGAVVRDTVFRTRDDEVAALQAQLAKVNAELERIKRRLANPKG